MTEADQRDFDWIAIDWGTTNLRAWAMKDGSPVARRTAPVGMAALDRDGFEPALLAAIGPWLPSSGTVPVVCCGMVGARQGWIEAPYVKTPSPPLDAHAFARAPVKDGRIEVTIIHGMSQASPPDVMRGEETQIAGLLRLEPGFAGLVCLPGTHTKWATVEAGRVEQFSSFMTGELYALLATQSVLRHSLDGESDPEAFAEAVKEAADDPAQLAAKLFSIRARGLLDAVAPGRSRGRLSGLLIGLEVAAMRPQWQGKDVVLVGHGALAESYARALAIIGGEGRVVDAEQCTLAGLTGAWRMVEGDRGR